MIKDKLQIFLITYNRKSYLKRTFEQIFAENSPIRDFDIIILDNKSTDGTAELIEEYREKFHNINHIINNRNIGGNANIAKAFELASKEYVWVLCDDDIFHWECFSEIEKAISDSYDLIMTGYTPNVNCNSVYDILFHLTFLPFGIYKTSILTDDVMRNIYDNIINIFPHLVPAISVIKNKGRIYLPSGSIVQNGIEYAIKNNISSSFYSYSRGNNEKNLFPITQNMTWFIGYVNSLTLLNDKKAIMHCIFSAMNCNLLENNIFDVARIVVFQSLKDNLSTNLYYDFYLRVNLWVKLILIYYRYSPICFYKTDKGINIQIYNKIKFRVFPKL